MKVDRETRERFREKDFTAVSVCDIEIARIICDEGEHRISRASGPSDKIIGVSPSSVRHPNTKFSVEKGGHADCYGYAKEAFLEVAEDVEALDWLTSDKFGRGVIAKPGDFCVGFVAEGGGKSKKGSLARVTICPKRI